MAPDERRKAIIDAVIPLLVQHGPTVTTKQIAEAAGIAEGTIFRAFPDKDSLIRAAIEAVLDREPLEQAFGEIDPDLPFEDALREAVALIQERSLRVWRLASAVGPRFHDASRKGMTISPGLTDLCKAHRAQLAVVPAEAAQVLNSLTVALSHPTLIDRPMKPAAIVQRFLHGVTKGGASC